MKRKRIVCSIFLWILVAMLIFTVGMLILRPDFRFTAKQTLASITANEKPAEISAESLTLNKISADDLSGCTVDQSLMLVNRENILPDDFSADIVEYKDSGVEMNRCITDSYSELSKAVADNFGENLYIISSYRTAEEQEEIEDEQGSDTAMPSGSSEHQTGLALDVYVDRYAGKAFIKSEAGRFVNENCWKYGFIIRYPAAKKSVTGIDYEPWHIRYVGSPHAELISKGCVTLEEYYEELEYGKFYKYDGYIITRQSGEFLEIPQGKNCVISSDNMGGYVITVKE